MSLDGQGKLFHLYHPAPTRPAVPTVEECFCLFTTINRLKDLSQCLSELPCLGGLETHFREGLHLLVLFRCPLRCILQVAPTTLLQKGLGLDFLSSYGIDNLVGHLDDVELIEGDLCPRQG